MRPFSVFSNFSAEVNTSVVNSAAAKSMLAATITSTETYSLEVVVSLKAKLSPVDSEK